MEPAPCALPTVDAGAGIPPSHAPQPTVPAVTARTSSIAAGRRPIRTCLRAAPRVGSSRRTLSLWTPAFPPRTRRPTSAAHGAATSSPSLAARLRREPDDVDVILPFDEVVEALGRRGERRLGLQTIDLDSIVGTVDRSRREFDRSFRPTSHRVRRRWQGIATAMRRGADMPPIDVYRVGDLHFVVDGHHRVSVARQLGLEKIDAMRHRDHHRGRRRRGDLAARPAAQVPRAAVLRARAAAAPSARADPLRTASTTPGSPRASRRGACG